jgi:hypothetical protein
MTLISDPKESIILLVLFIFIITGAFFWIFQFYNLISPFIRDDLIAIAVVLPTAFLTVWGLMDILNRVGFFRIFWGIS